MSDNDHNAQNSSICRRELFLINGERIFHFIGLFLPRFSWWSDNRPLKKSRFVVLSVTKRSTTLCVHRLTRSIQTAGKFRMYLITPLCYYHSAAAVRTRRRNTLPGSPVVYVPIGGSNVRGPRTITWQKQPRIRPSEDWKSQQTGGSRSTMDYFGILITRMSPALGTESGQRARDAPAPRSAAIYESMNRNRYGSFM
jgi:hypothetical protein